MTPEQIATEIKAAMLTGPTFRLYCQCWDSRDAEFHAEPCVRCRLEALADRIEADAEAAVA